MSSQAKRASLAAALIVITLASVILLAGAAGGQKTIAVSAPGSVSASCLDGRPLQVQGDDASDNGGDYERRLAERLFASVGGGSVGSAAVSAQFTDEFFDPGILAPEQVAARDRVVGIVSSLGVADALGKVRDAMESNGWESVGESAGEGVQIATFEKTAGPCTWAQVLAQPVLDVTSIVVLFGEG